MKEPEGVIKYHLNHQNAPIAKRLSISEINAWRTVFFKLGLIGQYAEKYEGYGFGNISQRITLTNTNKVQFIISGTQTGHLESLSRHHYCSIQEACTQENKINSIGETKPSSEALTHASIYQQSKEIQSVIHVHCPKIWNNTHPLKIPYTSKDIAYGTPEMAHEVKRLFLSSIKENTAIFSMLGHEDGIIAFSNSMEKAAGALIKLFSCAIALEQNKQQR